MVGNRASFHASTARPSTAARSFPRSSVTPYEHPYLASKSDAQKKELGLIDLLRVKVFRCFVVEDSLPPPDPNAIVYQADKSSSTTVSVTTTTNTNTTTTNTNSTPVRESPLIKLPKYNKPPPEQPKKPKLEYRFASPSTVASPIRSEDSANGEEVAPLFKLGNDDRNSDSKAESPPPVQTFGKVSSLSAMFENNN